VREAILAYASRIVGERLDDDIWSKDDVPPHLVMNIRVVDEARRELAMGRDLEALQRRLGEAATLTLAKAKPGMEREDIRAWDFGELPEQVSFKRGNQTLTGYPALTPSPSESGVAAAKAGGRGDGDSVAIRLYDTPDKATESHREGVKRLLAIELREQVKNLDRALSGFNALAIKYHGVIAAEKLKTDLVAAILDRAFIGEDTPPRTAKAFEEQKKRAKARLPAVSEAALRHAQAIAEALQPLASVIAQSGALGRITQEVKAARDRLVYPGFLAATPWERLEHIPRYLRGYGLRLQKYRTSAERDQRQGQVVAGLWEQYEARRESDRAAGRRDGKLEDFRWLLEELRVSLFAQELRTPFPVSAKRLQRFWDENLR
jgi:ATP-dependent helicase HrpA